MTNLNQKYQFILQSYATVCLMAELQNYWNDFIHSDFFKNLKGDDDILDMFRPLQHQKIHQYTQTLSIGNTGSFPMILYSLLVLPQEAIKELSQNQKFQEIKIQLEKEYDVIDELLSDDIFIKDNTNSDYENKDCNKTKNGNRKYDFIYHIRNSVSHGTLELNNNPQDSWLFSFKDKSDNTSSRKIKEIKKIIKSIPSTEKDQIITKLDEIQASIKASAIKENSVSFSSKFNQKNIGFLVQNLVNINKKFIKDFYSVISK